MQFILEGILFLIVFYVLNHIFDMRDKYNPPSVRQLYKNNGFIIKKYSKTQYAIYYLEYPCHVKSYVINAVDDWESSNRISIESIIASLEILRKNIKEEEISSLKSIINYLQAKLKEHENEENNERRNESC